MNKESKHFNQYLTSIILKTIKKAVTLIDTIMMKFCIHKMLNP